LPYQLKLKRMALVLRELGRIERTLFMLDWLLDPQLHAVCAEF